MPPFDDPTRIPTLNALCASFLRFFENDQRFAGIPVIPDERPVSPGDTLYFRGDLLPSTVIPVGLHNNDWFGDLEPWVQIAPGALHNSERRVAETQRLAQDAVSYVLKQRPRQDLTRFVSFNPAGPDLPPLLSDEEISKFNRPDRPLINAPLAGMAIYNRYRYGVTIHSATRIAARIMTHAQPEDFSYLVWLDMLYAWTR